MDQPPHAALETPLVRTAAAVLFVAGSVLVATSMWALGVTGTYLGDYFGILMDEMVTGFPFNVVADPMYVGSTLNFVAVALWYARPAGLALSVLVWLTYRAALAYEGPFTTEIYRQAAERRDATAQTQVSAAATAPLSGPAMAADSAPGMRSRVPTRSPAHP